MKKVLNFTNMQKKKQQFDDFEQEKGIAMGNTIMWKYRKMYFYANYCL